MLESLKQQYADLKEIPPWRQNENTKRNIVVEGIGAPEPGQYRLWKNSLRKLKSRINKLAEEEARQQINRP